MYWKLINDQENDHALYRYNKSLIQYFFSSLLCFSSLLNLSFPDFMRNSDENILDAMKNIFDWDYINDNKKDLMIKMMI